jgi:hypothetical protein
MRKKWFQGRLFSNTCDRKHIQINGDRIGAPVMFALQQLQLLHIVHRKLRVIPLLTERGYFSTVKKIQPATVKKVSRSLWGWGQIYPKKMANPILHKKNLKIDQINFLVLGFMSPPVHQLGWVWLPS